MQNSYSSVRNNSETHHVKFWLPLKGREDTGRDTVGVYTRLSYEATLHFEAAGLNVNPTLRGPTGAIRSESVTPDPPSTIQEIIYENYKTQQVVYVH